MRNYRLFLGLVILYWLPISLFSQTSFLDILNQYETWDNHAIASSPDGGFVIGNNLKFPPEDWERHAFYLSKYDSCGLSTWTKAYGHPDYALYFADLAALPGGQIAVMGQTGYDDLFLMRIDAEGTVLNMYTFNTANGDQNYTLSVQAGRMMVFGSHYTGSGAQNFILLVQPDGQVDWARSYHQRVGPGAATYCADGSFICKNGNLIYKVNPSGDLDWSRQIGELTAAEAHLSAPVDVGDGYVLAVRRPDAGRQYLIKLAPDGQLVWQSDDFSASMLASDLSVLSNGHLVFVNAQVGVDETAGGNGPFLLECSPQGELLQRYDFDLGEFGRFTPPICEAGPRQLVTIKGSYYTKQHYDYVLRLQMGGDLGCAGMPVDLTTEAAPPIQLQPIQTSARSLNFSSADTAQVRSIALPWRPLPYCQVETDTGSMAYYDKLQCVDTLHFQPPFDQATYRWEDGSTTGNRVLQAPAHYRLTAKTCRTAFDIEIALELGNCPCEFYLPNAFSPNGDQINDHFKALASCAFTDYQLRIFNRWGELLYQSQIPEDGWNGMARGQQVETGVYMYEMQYAWEIKPGRIQREATTGTITVVY